MSPHKVCDVGLVVVIIHNFLMVRNDLSCSVSFSVLWSVGALTSVCPDLLHVERGLANHHRSLSLFVELQPCLSSLALSVSDPQVP